MNIIFSDFAELLSWKQGCLNSSLKVTAVGGHERLKIRGLEEKLYHNKVANWNQGNGMVCGDP